MDEWPERALSMLDSLWAVKTRMPKIRQMLLPLLGFEPTSDQIRVMANRCNEPARKVARAAARPSLAQTESRVPVPVRNSASSPTIRNDDRVGLVKPGAHPTRGFSMLGGTLR